MGWFKRKTSSIKYLHIDTPTAASDRRGIAIALCVKNERDYIAEWALFHKAIGVRHFIVYDNGCTDDTVEILRSVLGPEELSVIPWAGRAIDASTGRLIDGQVLAFAHAIANFGGSFERMAFIDADEFLLPRNGSTLQEALRAVGDFPNLSLPWHMFGPSGHVSKPAGPVLLNYTMRMRDPLSRAKHSTNFKCIVDPCEVTEVSVHQFRTRHYGELTVNDAGQRTPRRGRKAPSFYSNQYLQLNHYYSKSRDEMARKIQRGWNYAISDAALKEKMDTTLRNIESDTVEDRAMVDFVIANDILLDPAR
jgi:hypothetical protein